MWKKGKGVKKDVWENRSLKKEVNISTDSTKRYFVSEWQTNRVGNAVKLIKAHRPVKNKSDANKLVREIVRRKK